MRRLLFVVLIGLGGLAILISLGIWQVQRLAWKEGVLARIESRISDAPVDLPGAPDPEADRFLPVAVDGTFEDAPFRVLISQKQVGAGWRLVQPFETDDGRRILVDRGVVSADNAEIPAPGPARVVGNLLWPDEVDGFTPDPDLRGNIWYARDVGRMASVAGTEPLLVVARAPTGGGVAPLPVGTEGIPNDHLQYAITWFSLAVVWAGMTGLWLWRIRRGQDEESV